MSDIKKVEVVTGASQGLSEGAVQALHGRGYTVVATSRSTQASADPDLVKVADEIGDPETGKWVIAAASEKFGRIDTLMNNAGLLPEDSIIDATEEQYRLTLKTDLDGFFRSQKVISVMFKQGSGHVAQIMASTVASASSDLPSVLASLTKGGSIRPPAALRSNLPNVAFA